MDRSWTPYRPGANTPWNARRVVHLHRRAGFAATWVEVERDLESDPQLAVDRVLHGKASITAVPPVFASMSRVIGDAAVAANNPNRLKAWWLYRMLFTPDPLAERLTLMWHNHFATSNLKVQDIMAMRRQNEIFREFSRAPFGDLLPRVLKDPAMLVWLDAQANRKEHPNENLAREVMELFTLGVNHFTESDVKESARAFTGWGIKDDTFREFEQYHDAGDKTIFGRTGKWRGDDVARMLLDHPATSQRLARRICELFMGEGTVDSQAMVALADGLREHDLNIGWAVETVLRSENFFSDSNIGNRIRAPTEFVIGCVRALELFDPPPSTLILSEWSATLGQDLFYPPNVFGWPGGRSWISSRSILARAQFAAALVDGSLRSPASPVDGLALARTRHSDRDLAAIIDFYTNLLLGRPPDSEISARILSSLRTNPALDAATIRHVMAVLLSSPEAQLG